MGPTNVALVNLLRADQKLRQARQRLEEATKNVRLRTRRLTDLRERFDSAAQTLKQDQTHNAELDLDLKTRESRLEKLRAQQQNARNNKEYQALLIEINTEKVDRAKVEDQLLTAMQAVDQGKKSTAELEAQIKSAQEELDLLQSQLSGRIAELQGEIDAIQPQRDAAAAAVPAGALAAFERLAERMDGEPMSAIGQPNPKREEYICTECNMSLVVDIYNRLHVRDEVICCPSCQRILYIPDNLTPERAVGAKKEPRPRSSRKSSSASSASDAEIPAAAPNRQSSATDVLESTRVESEEPVQGQSNG